MISNSLKIITTDTSPKFITNRAWCSLCGKETRIKTYFIQQNDNMIDLQQRHTLPDGWKMVHYGYNWVLFCDNCEMSN